MNKHEPKTKNKTTQSVIIETMNNSFATKQKNSQFSINQSIDRSQLLGLFIFCFTFVFENS